MEMPSFGSASAIWKLHTLAQRHRFLLSLIEYLFSLFRQYVVYDIPYIINHSLSVSYIFWYHMIAKRSLRFCWEQRLNFDNRQYYDQYFQCRKSNRKYQRGSSYFPFLGSSSLYNMPFKRFRKMYYAMQSFNKKTITWNLYLDE